MHSIIPLVPLLITMINSKCLDFLVDLQYAEQRYYLSLEYNLFV